MDQYNGAEAAYSLLDDLNEKIPMSRRMYSELHNMVAEALNGAYDRGWADRVEYMSPELVSEYFENFIQSATMMTFPFKLGFIEIKKDPLSETWRTQVCDFDGDHLDREFKDHPDKSSALAYIQERLRNEPE